ncbi:MAG: DUF167 family protein [Candidatus Paceibacterota bacterium]|jgi:uncharacterized protein YggU (UPF0235/DUF167 family)
MYIKVKVLTGQKKEEFKEKNKDTFEIKVKEKAERNMANLRVLELVSLHLKINRKKIKIIKGQHTPSKILEIRN